MACHFKKEMIDLHLEAYVHLEYTSQGAACLFTLKCPGRTAAEL